ncbi:hypothetical protein [Conchiformibius kuhniae]|uniref:Uncharacterized protein n=1 Tax=Conchiformibius kuhniae TaxID=211502 RepID=A0ABD8B7Y8_9NEIS|nr:hypothetical protein [Conchiformibius kuhniae]
MNIALTPPLAALIADTDFPDDDVIIGSTLGSWRDAAALVFDMI